MKIIAENIHIISPRIKEAVINKNNDFLNSITDDIIAKKPDYIDLNVGPAKKNLQNSLTFLADLIQNKTDIKMSLDSTNSDEIEHALEIIKNTKDCIINSTSADNERMERLFNLAKNYDTKLIALTLTRETGIPKSAEEKLELAFSIFEKAEEMEFDTENLIFDPLVLPVSVEQSQAYETLNAIRLFKESFNSKTVIGLSNISNGSPKELRPLINRTFAVMAMGAGLDYVIADIFDEELIRIINVLENNSPQKDCDNFLIKLKTMIENFETLDSIPSDNLDETSVKFYKCAEILMNNKIYSHSFLDI